MARIKERFTWKGLYKDSEIIVSYCPLHTCIVYTIHHFCTLQVASCDICQRVNDKIITDKPELHPVPVHSPWHHVGIDFVGPISPASNSGNKYILTLSDYFTKWVEAVALPTKEAPGVANALYKVCCRRLVR